MNVVSLNYDRSFIVLANGIRIIKFVIVQATEYTAGDKRASLFCSQCLGKVEKSFMPTPSGGRIPKFDGEKTLENHRTSQHPSSTKLVSANAFKAFLSYGFQNFRK